MNEVVRTEVDRGAQDNAPGRLLPRTSRKAPSTHSGAKGRFAEFVLACMGEARLRPGVRSSAASSPAGSRDPGRSGAIVGAFGLEKVHASARCIRRRPAPMMWR